MTAVEEEVISVRIEFAGIQNAVAGNEAHGKANNARPIPCPGSSKLWCITQRPQGLLAHAVADHQARVQQIVVTESQLLGEQQPLLLIAKGCLEHLSDV